MNKFIKDTQLFILEDDKENESDELDHTVESNNVNKTLNKFMVTSVAQQDDHADR